LKRADDYVLTGQPVNFYTVVEAARQRGEIAIGYRLHAQAESAAAAYGIQINPKKSNLVTFSEGDRIIILAEE
jgi:ion channel POLLUX/CASTOR